MTDQENGSFREFIGGWRAGDHGMEQLTPLALAYLGDAVFELAVRTHVAATLPGRVRDLHRKTSSWVRAESQARVMHHIMDQLHEDEAAMVRRARNAKSSVPRNARVSDYRYSTAFEALLGYLYVTGNLDRLHHFIKAALAYESKGDV